MKWHLAALLAVGVALAVGSAQEPPPAARFHHVHLNTTDPAASIDFYSSRFAAERAKFLGRTDAVLAQKVWLLFTRVAQAPPWELVSSIWHIGWGAEDMKRTYEEQLAKGTKFFTPLTDISDLANTPGFFYAYVESSDKALIELNTAQHHNFGHLHLFSADPVGAGEWYMKHFGASRRGTRPPSREPRFYRDVQVGPSMSLMMDQVNIIIYPVEYAKKQYADHWKGAQELVSTRGRSIDHIGFSVDHLDATLARLRAAGVAVTGEPRGIDGTSFRYAFIEGPDKIRIEVVEEGIKQP